MRLRQFSLHGQPPAFLARGMTPAIPLRFSCRSPISFLLLASFITFFVTGVTRDDVERNDTAKTDDTAHVSFPPFPSAGCNVGLINYLIPGEELRDCNEELESLKDGGERGHNALLESGTRQHLFLRHGKTTVGKNGGWTTNVNDVDFWLLDDTNSLACYTLHSTSSAAMNASDLKRKPTWYTEDRERFVGKFLYDPHQLHGKPLVVIEDYIWHKLYNTDSPRTLFKLVLEVGQVRSRLRSEQRHVVIPYSTPMNEFLRPAGDLEDRYRVYLRGMCYRKGQPREGQPVGKKLRAALVNALEKVPSTVKVLALCTCKWCNATVDYRTVRRELAESRYCLVVPGDTSSSRRLADAIVAGCIPVIVGEPWHALPYLPYLDYSEFALFVRILEPPFGRLEGNLSKPTIFTRDPLEDTVLGDGSKLVKELGSVNDLLAYLESIQDSDVFRLKQGVRRVAEMFASWNGPASQEAVSHGRTYAMNWALGAACRRMKEIGMLAGEK